jgi:predicted DNA-binding transcriptional regulator YafY
VVISYRDAEARGTTRTIWPFALGFFERSRVVVAWCESRRDYRHFRLDRVARLEVTGTRYPRGRAALLADWRQDQGEGKGRGKGKGRDKGKDKEVDAAARN